MPASVNAPSFQSVAPSTQDACAAQEATYPQLAALRRSMRLFANFSERVSRGSGLSALEYQALLAIRTLSPPGATRNALCRELALRWKETEALVQRLEQSRLVRIESDAIDRRFRRLVLTGRGEMLLARLASRHLDEIRRNIRTLTRTLTSLSEAPCVNSMPALSQIV